MKLIEFRGADMAANIYLVIGLLIAAGLDGLRNKINPIGGTSFNVDKLSDEEREELGITKTPSNLEEALDALLADKYLCDFLGPQFIEIFMRTKRKEWADYSKNVKNNKTSEVTDWEFNLMFEKT